MIVGVKVEVGVGVMVAVCVGEGVSVACGEAVTLAVEEATWLGVMVGWISLVQAASKKPAEIARVRIKVNGLNAG